jgi:hypothetical protein
MTLLESAAPRPVRSNVLNGWTAGRVDLLKELWSVKQWSAHKIALELGGFEHCADGGRSAVIGKVHRLKLPSRECDRSGLSKATSTGRRREARPKTRHIASHIIKVAREAAERVVEEAAPEPDARHSAASARAAARPHAMKPAGSRSATPGIQTSAFAPTAHADGSSYCARHHRLAYTPRAPARPRSERKETGWG